MTLRERLEKVSLAGGQQQEATRNVLRAVRDWLEERADRDEETPDGLHAHLGIMREIEREIAR